MLANAILSRETRAVRWCTGSVGDALHPDRAGLLVPMFDAAARIGDLVGAHGRVADEDHLVVGGELVQHVERRDLLGVPSGASTLL